MCRSFLLALLICQSVFAQTPFVTAQQLDIASLLPAPPAAGSPAEKAELAELIHIQETRSPDQVARAKADDADESIFIYRNVVGDQFNPRALPLTASLSAKVHANEGVVVNPAKQYFHRVRPYIADQNVKPVCRMKEDPKDYAYPSGHSTSGYLEALVLLQILPEKRNEILARADDYAHNRLVCGMHYPSDPVVSKLTAYAMLGLMLNNAEFRKELTAAKAETRAALGLPTSPTE
jgi:acid phosphatase (class A)